MWEIDPEIKQKLLGLQKDPVNSICADCSSPAPQWASPKFGTFICLDCAGLHRGLGVHISFVRSVMMDSFKAHEIRRLEIGGNRLWREFWEAHPKGENKFGWNKMVPDRYTGEVGEEYKERLSAKVDGREYVAPPVRDRDSEAKVTDGNPESSMVSNDQSSSWQSNKVPRITHRYTKDISHASKDDHIPHVGFGSGQSQINPMSAFSKGVGWFTSTVSKSAYSVNQSWIQPSIEKLSETDLARTARVTASEVASDVQKRSKGVADSFNRFAARDIWETGRATSPERKEFWENFGSNDANGPTRSIGRLSGIGEDVRGDSIGTSALHSAGQRSSSEETLGLNTSGRT